MNHYELRTSRGTPVMAFDDKRRAIAERDRRSLQLGSKLHVVQIERIERMVG